MTNTIHNLRKLFPIAIVLFAMSFLASCSSSNQFASSFSKRKYTKGHFSDPIANVKTNQKSNAVVASVNPPITHEVSNTGITKNTKTETTLTPSTPAKTTTVASIKKNVHSAIATAITPIQISLSKAPNSISTNNTTNASLKDASVSKSDMIASGGDHDGGGRRHHFLRACFTFLLLWLIFGLIGFFSAFFWFLSGVCFVIAVIFFIMWLITVAD